MSILYHIMSFSYHWILIGSMALSVGDGVRPLTRAKNSSLDFFVLLLRRPLHCSSRQDLTPDRRAGADTIWRSARVSSTGGRSIHSAPQDPGRRP